MSSRPAAKKIAFGLVAALALLALAEVGLRLGGFHFSRTPAYMQFNFPNPNELHNIFEPDPKLLWKMRPGYDFGEGFDPLNAEGFRGPDFSASKRRGVLRVACLGDSVTFGGPEAAYPELLAKMAEQAGQIVEVMNLGVPGYSSFQGLALAREILPKYRPDVVVIMFGWNDHWLAKGFSDKGQANEKDAAPPPDNPLRHLRLYQAIDMIAVMAQSRISPPPEVLRVAPGEFRENLAALVDLARAEGARVVLATPPSALGAGKVPDYLASLDFISSDSELKPLHQKYMDIIRETAKEKGVALADLDLIFMNRNVNSLFNDPEKDIIHPNREGYEIVAGEIAKKVASAAGHE